MATLQANTCTLKLFPHPFLERHTAALFQAIQTHLRISSSVPVLYYKSDQAHGNSEALSIPHNLPGVQNTEAIRTLMPFRTLTETSVTKPPGLPVTECMTLHGKVSISLEAKELFSNRTDCK